MSSFGVFRQKSISLDALESALSVEGYAVVSKTEIKLLNECQYIYQFTLH